MANYNPRLVVVLTDLINHMAGLSLTQNDVLRELESLRERYAPPEPAPMVEAGPGPYRYENSTPLPEFSFRPLGPTLTPDEALTRLHTMRPADPMFTRSYMGDAS